MQRDVAVALVDFGNTILPGDSDHPAFGTRARVVSRLDGFVESICRKLARCVPAVVELEVRLYAGWRSSAGVETPSAVWAKTRIPQLPRRCDGRRVFARLALSPACRPGERLLGTHRSGGQKMVDTMMTVDALHFANRVGTVVFVTDDDDFVPVAVAVAMTPRPRANLIWLRRREIGEGLNDAVLGRCDLTLDVLGGFP